MGEQRVTDGDQVFLSYSRNDLEAATRLRGELDQYGLSVFKDDQSIREGDLWLDRLQEAVDACSGFVVLVGRDGVGRWIGAETQTALGRYFGPHDDAERLPIFPILLGETGPEVLPAFLRLFQATPWNGSDPLPGRLLERIRERTIVASEEAVFEGCPFVGLDAFRTDQARLFFGRQKETLDALACFDTRPGSPAVRWLEINGNSGAGKSSLMNAGLLPLVDQGWLWPRTGYGRWRRIGPMMPGERPLTMLTEQLARVFGAEMADVSERLEGGDDRALAYWLRSRKEDETAFLLAVDQFEELFTFAELGERRRFDRLLATALEDPDCPLFVISTVRADFLDRFAEDLPRLADASNRRGKAWRLPPIGADGLREVIDGPTRLAGLDASEVREAMVAEARDEPGALPLVENALHWLWERREGNRLSGRRFHEQGRLAGLLSRVADGLLDHLEPEQRDNAMALLFRLVKVDPEGRRHTRRRIPLAEALTLAGGGERGHDLIYRLAGLRALDGARTRGPLRLITVTEEATGRDESRKNGHWVNLIHETLIRSKGADAQGRPRPYWATLWDYIERHKAEAVSLEVDRLLAWGLVQKIEKAAVEWDSENRDEDRRWSEERIRDALRELAQRGTSASDLVRSEISRTFLGPTDPEEIRALLALSEDRGATRGSGGYGAAWRLPLSHESRANLGERLACLGDTRPGVGVREDGAPDIDWVEIPGGLVELEDGTGKSRVAPFFMARYLVTNAQFQAFVDAEDGYGKPDWWEGMPTNANKGSVKSRWSESNRPRVTVSWYEAVAFCRWLSARLGFEVRLPTEHEWQQAATGGDPSNVYPWGREWDALRCNTRESRLKRTTAVGLYSASASPQGVLDLSGNVWEWCRCKRVRPEDTAVDASGESRVLRGGSWVYDRGFARAGYRYGDHPYVRFVSRGFRVSCASPIR